jgi:hypothetical protein
MNDKTRDNYDLNQLSHPPQAVEAAPIVALRSVRATSSESTSALSLIRRHRAFLGLMVSA